MMFSFTSTTHTCCWRIEYTARRPVPERSGSGLSTSVVVVVVSSTDMGTVVVVESSARATVEAASTRKHAAPIVRRIISRTLILCG
jgi:hypothetical protein